MTTTNENTIIGGDKDDRIFAYLVAGSDYSSVFAFGNGGDDTIWNQGYLHAELHGGDGDDFIGSLSKLTDTLFGDVGSDRIYLGVEDTGYGGEGGDLFTIAERHGGHHPGAAHGEAGNDLFVLRNNSEIWLDGGDGKDTVVIGRGSSLPRLTSVETIGIDELTYLDAPRWMASSTLRLMRK